LLDSMADCNDAPNLDIAKRATFDGLRRQII